ncbi:MAG: hypothetical protein VKN72_12560 [Nostocales cyanobacterium 94392]|nr:hypothetical protein [Nostocales cyanobacterium 94392]
MKINTFGSFFCISGVIAFFIIGTTDRAFAQSNVPSINQSVLNGLYSPRASEKFFEEGNRKIEREIQILQNPERYKHKDILQNNAVDIKTIEKKQTIPTFNDYYKQLYGNQP